MPGLRIGSVWVYSKRTSHSGPVRPDPDLPRVRFPDTLSCPQGSGFEHHQARWLLGTDEERMSAVS